MSLIPRTARSVRGARPFRTRRSNTAGSIVSWLFVSMLLVGCQDSGDREAEIRSLIEARRFEESVELLEDALKESPSDPELLYLYGFAQLGLSKPSFALWSFLATREHPDWQTKANLALIRVGILANDRELSIEAASRILSSEPDHAVARALRADSFIQTKAYEAALEDADWLLDRDGNDVAAHATRLQALIGLERIEEIEDDFDKLETLWKDEAFPPALAQRYCVARAVFADENGDPQQAATRFEGCLESFPSGRGVLREAVSFFDKTEGPERGTAILEAALEREPMAINLREMLASRLTGQGETEAATQLLIDATRESGPARTRAWTALAYHYFDAEDFEASVAAWRELFELLEHPNEGILFAFAESLVQAGRLREAEEVTKQLHEAMAELVRGLIFLERGEPERALEHFDAGQRLWPNNAVARFLAGRAAERSADIDRAIKEFRHSIRVDAVETPAALHLARILEAEGNLESARTSLVYYLKERPTDVEARLLSLRISAQVRGPAIIERSFAGMRWPRNEMGTIVGELAEIVMQTGGPDTTLRFLKSVRGVDFGAPENADATRAFVNALAASERADAAQRAIQRALEAHPESAAFHEIRGSLLERMSAPQSEFRVAHERAIELDPEHARSLAVLGELALRQGRKDEARRLFELAGASDPKQFSSRRRAAELAAQAGELEEAERRLWRILSDSPVDTRVATRLAGIALDRGGDLDRALKLARTAVRFRGGSEAFAMLNRVHIAAGTTDRAIATLENAKPLQGNDPSLHYHLGDALRTVGRREDAVLSLQEAISLGSTHDFPERAAAEAALAELSQRASAGDSQG